MLSMMSSRKSAAYPIIVAASLFLLELALRLQVRRLHQISILEDVRYLFLNGILGLGGIVLASLALRTQHEYLLLGSFEIVWVQAAVLKVCITVFEKTIHAYML
jgi:hypothetical protein